MTRSWKETDAVQRNETWTGNADGTCSAALSAAATYTNAKDEAIKAMCRGRYAASTPEVIARPGSVVVVVVAAPTAGFFSDRDLDALVSKLLG